MQRSSTSTFGFILFSLLVPVVMGVLATLIAYLKDRKQRNLTIRQLGSVGAETAGLTLGGVGLAVLAAYLVVFIPTIYQLHTVQAQMIIRCSDDNTKLSAEIEDRKMNTRVYEPAYEHTKVIYGAYAAFRRAIGKDTRCQFKITSPQENGAADPIIRQIADPAGIASNCAAFGPMIAAMDPSVEPESRRGAEQGIVIIHTRPDQAGSLALYDALASYIPVKRSFSMPKDQPEVLV